MTEIKTLTSSCGVVFHSGIELSSLGFDSDFVVRISEFPPSSDNSSRKDKKWDRCSPKHRSLKQAARPERPDTYSLILSIGSDRDAALPALGICNFSC